MPQALFDLPLDQMNYDIVQEFIDQKHPEGTRIEYKAQIPDHGKIATTIAALANTHVAFLSSEWKHNQQTVLYLFITFNRKYESINLYSYKMQCYNISLARLFLQINGYPLKVLIQLKL